MSAIYPVMTVQSDPSARSLGGSMFLPYVIHSQRRV